MKITWNLRVLMAQHQINSATELARRLKAVGVTRSVSQISRMVRKMPNRLNTELLYGLLKIFQCQVSDLIIIEHNLNEIDT